jgi:hypothetical protein
MCHLPEDRRVLEVDEDQAILLAAWKYTHSGG